MIRTQSEPRDYLMRFTDGEREALADATPDHGGTGEGFRPHDLLEAALANCIGISVRMYAKAHGIPLEGVRVAVELDRSDPARAEFKYSVELLGDVAPELRERFMRAARSCSVHKTLLRELVFTQVDAL